MDKSETTLLLQSPEYSKLKRLYEKDWFKLRGHYCNLREDGSVLEYTINEIAEEFINKRITITVDVEESSVNKKTGNVTKTIDSKVISKSFFQVWRMDENIRSYKDIVFNADVKNVKPSSFNMFTGFNHFNHLKKKEVDLSVILDHIKSLCGYNEEMYEGYIAYLAQLVQIPHVLPHSTFVFIGSQGSGKDKHYTFLSKVIGEKYCVIIDKLESITGKFNTVLAGKLLVTINETDPKESREREAALKHLTTTEEVQIEGKYKDPVKAKNYARMNHNSNKTFAYPMEPGARRPRICKTSDKYANMKPEEAKKKYFDKLIKQMNDEDTQYAFLRYLQNYDISEFDFQKVIKSELHVELEKYCAPVMANFLLKEVSAQVEDEKKHKTMDLYRSYHIWLKINNFKHETDTKKFKFELTNTYNIKASNLGGYPYYTVNKTNLLLLLKDKFKIEPKDIVDTEEDDDDGEPKKQLTPEEMKEKIEMEINELKNEMKRKLEQLEKIIPPKKEIDWDMEMKRIKKISESINAVVDEIKNAKIPTMNKTNKTEKAEAVLTKTDELFDLNDITVLFD